MNQKYPKVTLITVTYNAEKYLEQTIKSILEQDYSNIEYIIIDGGSNDSTIDIIKKYEQKISYWISEPDNGIYDAMNKGIDLSTGKWINFMNAGDIFTDNTILSMIFETPLDYDVIYGGANLYYQDENKYIYDAPREPQTIYNRLPCIHQTMFIKDNYMKKNKYNTYFKLSSDVELFFGLYTQNCTFYIIQKPIVNFLMGGISQNDRIKSHIEVLAITSKYIQKSQDIYKHSSYTILQRQNQYIDNDDNLTFSLMFNNLIKEIASIRLNYKNIVIYGNSHIGRYLQESLNKSNQIIMVDYNFDGINSLNPEILKNYDFDIIVIAVLGREDSIINFLIDNIGINISKIKKLKL